jgi:hypothetical protein
VNQTGLPGCALSVTEHRPRSKCLGITGTPKPDLATQLHGTLNNACRKWGAREIRLRYLPKPSLNRWIAEALIDHHRVIEKIHADMPAGDHAGHGELQ